MFSPLDTVLTHTWTSTRAWRIAHMMLLHQQYSTIFKRWNYRNKNATKSVWIKSEATATFFSRAETSYKHARSHCQLLSISPRVLASHPLLVVEGRDGDRVFVRASGAAAVQSQGALGLWTHLHGGQDSAVIGWESRQGPAVQIRDQSIICIKPHS